MFGVDNYAAVRRFVFIEGHSRREAARVFGLSRETVLKMCRFSLPPGYTRKVPAAKPKLGALLPVIDTILEGDRTGPVKQRHTAFAFFGGVPLSLLYDNTTIAVAKICGDGKRERTRAFTELVSHYLFADRFGRPGKGNDPV